MEGWKTVRLGDVCELSKKQHDGSLLPYLGMEHIESGTGLLVSEPEAVIVKSNTFRFDKNKVLYGRLRPYLNKVYLPDFEGHCSTEIFPITCRNTLEKKFLFYWLISESVVSKINATSTGTRMPRANMNTFMNFAFPLPPLLEQQRIVAILEDAFTALAKAKENTERCCVLAREVFESERSRLFSEGKREFVLLGSVCLIVGGGTPSKRNDAFFDGDIPWATVRDMKNDILEKTECHITENAISQSSTNVIPEGNVVIATRVGLGKVCLLGQDTAINQDLRGIIPIREGQLFPRYLFHWFGFMAPSIVSAGTGATVQGVRVEFIKSLQMPILSFSDQKRIAAKLDDLSSQTKALEEKYQHKLAALEELKQSLLHRAFTGELTGNFREIERQLSEVGA